MLSAFQLRQAAALLHAGGVIAYPTEGVYGLGCLPGDSEAVERLLAIKGRSAGAGLILLAGHIDQLEPWIAADATERRRLLERRSQPTTWIVTARPGTPGWLTGGRTTLAVRITDHPLCVALCAQAASALVSTSANRSGKPPARSSLTARLKLGQAVDRVLCGSLGGAAGPSEIRVARNDHVLRPGR